jgi:hypothetical protein
MSFDGYQKITLASASGEAGDDRRRGRRGLWVGQTGQVLERYAIPIRQGAEWQTGA